MTTVSPAAAYIITRASSKDRQKLGISKLPGVVRQHYLLQSYAAANGFEITKFFVDATSHSARNFTTQPNFRAAVEHAEANNIPVILCDIVDLLRRLDKPQFQDAMRHLAALPFPLIDVSFGLPFAQLPKRVFAARMRAAKLRSNAIGVAIKANRKLTAGAPSREASVTASVVRSKNALATAIALRPRIRTIEDGLPPAVKLTPAYLARALNEAKIPAPRGGEWRRNTTTRLLKQYRDLTASNPASPPGAPA